MNSGGLSGIGMGLGPGGQPINANHLSSGGGMGSMGAGGILELSGGKKVHAVSFSYGPYTITTTYLQVEKDIFAVTVDAYYL